MIRLFYKNLIFFYLLLVTYSLWVFYDPIIIIWPFCIFYFIINYVFLGSKGKAFWAQKFFFLHNIMYLNNWWPVISIFTCSQPLPDEFSCQIYNTPEETQGGSLQKGKREDHRQLT